MIIDARVHTKALKRTATKKYDLRDFVGKLSLEATNNSDVALLRAMYNHCFGALEENGKGAIKVFDKDGKEVVHYFYQQKETADASK